MGCVQFLFVYAGVFLLFVADCGTCYAADDLVSVSPTTSYEVPRLTSLDGPGASEASTYGGETVFIRGANFGPPSSANSTSYFERVR
jgi:hypothetical protein